MRRKTKKTAAVLLTAISMLVTSVATPMTGSVQAATKKIKITNVSKGTLTIKKGSTYKLKAKVGNKSNLKFVWKSSQPQKVSVNKNGKIKGLKNGTSTITVSVKGKKYKKANIKVTVKTPVKEVKVLRPAMVLCVNSTATIVSKVLPEDASNKKLLYNSSDESIVTVNANGVVNGVKAGVAKVTVKAVDGSKKETTITVKVEKDTSEIRLVDDFYQSANGQLLEDTELDLKIGSWSQLSMLEEKQKEKVQQLIKDISINSNEEGSVEDKVADVYETALDVDTRNAQSMKTIQEYFKEIDQVSNLDSYVALAGKLSREGMDSVFSTFVYNDLKTVKNYQVYVNEINTGLSKEEFSGFGNLKKEYKDYVKTLLQLSGETEEEADANASSIIAFQRNVATTNKTVLQSYIVDNIYHPYTIQQLKQVFTNCDIQSYLKEAGYGEIKQFIVVNPEQLIRVNKYLKESNLNLLKEYTKLNILLQYAPYLTTEFFDAYADFNATKNMKEKEETIEEFSLDMVQKIMAWDISKLYVDKYIPKNTKQDIEKMIDSIVEEYNKQISQCSWMSASTKKGAMKKLNKIQKHVSYPDDWSSYLTKVTLKGSKEGGVLSENIQLLYQESEEKERNLLKDSGAGDKWILETPLTVNAYYMPNYNSITIPIGISEGDIYSKERSKAQNIGALGMIIGHEISHAFDANGAAYDENGELRNWWTKEDTKKYQSILNKLIEYYNTFEVLPGVFQNGVTTLSENIADLASINCVVKLVENNPTSRKEFFESYANVWAGEMTEELTQSNLLLDVHANQKVRVNAVVSLVDEFYETYDVKSTDAMYVAPEDRIRIW